MEKIENQNIKKVKTSKNPFQKSFPLSFWEEVSCEWHVSAALFLLPGEMSWPITVTWLSGQRFLLPLVVPLHRRFVSTRYLYNSAKNNSSSDEPVSLNCGRESTPKSVYLHFVSSEVIP